MEKNTLTEIKKGQTGTGLLIEHEGYISSDCGDNKKLFEDINSKIGTDEPICPEHFIVSAVFQKFGIENANGRIYPEHVLKREVEKYMEKIAGNKFGEKRAIGECYTPRAMVLSKDGWKPIAEINEGDEVLTLNPYTQENEYQKVTYKTETEWDGDMIHIEGSRIDDTVTPNHGFPIFKFNENETKLNFNGFKTAEELMNTTEDDLWLPTTQAFEISDDSAEIYDLRTAKYTKVPYKGKVYCIEVPNHIWYVKENDKCHWTKNCNHPDDTVINLSRVAMNIIELHWVGHTLVGKLEVLTSPGFRKYGIISCEGDQIANLLLQGIKIGVSSRGMGTVTNKMGVLYVGDDYEIVCWDIVSDPSTENSFITPEDNIPQRYIENKEDTKPFLSENANKIDKALEILRIF